MGQGRALPRALSRASPTRVCVISGYVRWLLPILAFTAFAGANLAPTAIVNLGFDDATIAFVAADSSGFYAVGNAGNQVLVVKVNPSGTMVYSRAFGGSAFTQPQAIAVDPSGAAYVVGGTQAADFPIAGGYLNSGNMFLTKLSPDGSTIVYSTYIGSGTATAVAVDAGGNAYVTGSAPSSGFVTTPFALMSNSAVDPYAQNVFVVKVAPDGSKPVWATFIAGNGIACSTIPGVACPLSNPGFLFAAVEQDTGAAIAVDAGGFVYIAGYTNSAGFPVTQGVVQPQYADPYGIERQGFVTKLSPDGSSLQYSTYLGNAQGEVLTAMALDAQGDAIIGGTTRQIPIAIKPGWPPSPLPQFNGGFIVKLDPQASTLIYSSGLGEGAFVGIAADSGGDAYITTFDTLPSFPVTPGGVSLTCYSQAFVEFDPSGSLLYSTELPQAGPLAVAGSSAALITGTALTIFGPASPSQPAVFALDNAASLAPAAQVVPGEILLVTGVNLGAQPVVTFDGVVAPILPAPPISPALINQVLIQVPFEVAGRSQTEMQTGSQLLTLAVTPSAPAIFATPGYGVTTPLNSDGTANSSANPAKLGSYMTIFVTGAGLFQGDLGTGAIAPLAPLFFPQLPFSVQIFSGNNPVHRATVLYAGSAPAQSDGIVQINFVLPVAPDLQLNPNAFLTIQVGSAQSERILINVTN